MPSESESAAAASAAGPAATLTREAAADLIPRFDGATLRFTSRRALEAPGRGGMVLGPLLLDLGAGGRLQGATLLEERRYWERSVVSWELPARASPHRLDVLGDTASAPGTVAVRWDAERGLCAIAIGSAVAPQVVALGPRAYAAVEEGRLVGLVADLRGFDRAQG